MAVDDLIDSFFQELEIWEDKYNGRLYKQALVKAVRDFRAESNLLTATGVYEAFFSAYWLGIQEEGTNPFLDLVRRIHDYEKSAGRLLDVQRDHYVHSVHVFLLGLAIFSSMEPYRAVFHTRATYPDAYPTRNEEFFFRWGLAALFHDIAYPLELALRQVNSYLEFICAYPRLRFQKEVHARLEIRDLERAVLPFLEPRADKASEFRCKYPLLCPEGREDPISLLALTISERLGLDTAQVHDSLERYVDEMGEKGRIDHAYYGAVIMLLWYHHLYEKTGWNPAYFYFSVLDSASAVLLHNYYKNGLMASPFGVGRLEAAKHPIAFLLILCDELHDWGREEFGSRRSSMEYPIDCDVECFEGRLVICYKFRNVEDMEGYLGRKRNEIHHILDIGQVFTDGIELNGEMEKLKEGK